MYAFRAALLAPLAVTAALVAGCGGSSSSSSSAPVNNTSSAAASSPTTTAASTSTSSPAVLITTKKSKFGTILAAGPKHTTVYLFEADHGSSSACSSACAAAWPPVTGTAKTVGAAHSSDLGTIKRAGGATQVTYKGHPLYWFIKDKDDEDVYGEGSKAFGASWYVLTPSGKKVDNDEGGSGSEKS
jgi:predicted lipoprotein with Yx(FWY)xxD motif